jgi:hypothetical protein
MVRAVKRLPAITTLINQQLAISTTQMKSFDADAQKYRKVTNSDDLV